MLSIMGILLGILAIAGFGYFKHHAEQVAIETADRTARNVVNEIARSRGREESEILTLRQTDTQDIDDSNASQEVVNENDT